MDHAYATCQPDQTVPTDDLGVQRSGLAFIAGYIASKMRHVDPTLGCRTADASPALLASVPSAWLTTISRGSLHVPASWWMAVVEDFDAQFCALMGPTFCRKAKIIERLVQIISRRRPPRTGLARGTQACSCAAAPACLLASSEAGQSESGQVGAEAAAAAHGQPALIGICYRLLPSGCWPDAAAAELCRA